jgi:hypothetical protein
LSNKHTFEKLLRLARRNKLRMLAEFRQNDYLHLIAEHGFERGDLYFRLFSDPRAKRCLRLDARAWARQALADPLSFSSGLLGFAASSRVRAEDGWLWAPAGRCGRRAGGYGVEPWREDVDEDLRWWAPETVFVGALIDFIEADSAPVAGDLESVVLADGAGLSDTAPRWSVLVGFPVEGTSVASIYRTLTERVSASLGRPVQALGSLAWYVQPWAWTLGDWLVNDWFERFDARTVEYTPVGLDAFLADEWHRFHGPRATATGDVASDHRLSLCLNSPTRRVMRRQMALFRRAWEITELQPALHIYPLRVEGTDLVLPTGVRVPLVGELPPAIVQHLESLARAPVADPDAVGPDAELSGQI